MFSRARFSAQSVQLSAAVVAFVSCGLAVLLAYPGYEWPAFVLAPIAFGAMVLMLVNRCPRCSYPVWKKGGEWPFEQPKNIQDKTCGRCGLDLTSKPE
ncbi:hypothetical protein [Terricaulis sp.]|uniref:hypothetical protein n=1 Tax=Terricaulis sp. TaxID=2768686 RepID=UPI002AC5D5E6|nr:hypothetical protein [Terricaulis sp.]MDZ4692270.1 hypothetical protein [Terricaulis sp.]